MREIPWVEQFLPGRYGLYHSSHVFSTISLELLCRRHWTYVPLLQLRRRDTSDPTQAIPGSPMFKGAAHSAPSFRTSPTPRPTGCDFISDAGYGLRTWLRSLTSASARSEPQGEVVGREDHRHPVMDPTQELVGHGRDDGAGVDRLACRTLPRIPQPRKREGLPVRSR